VEMAGKEGKNVGKSGKLGAEDKQRRLTLEGKEGGKKVMFKVKNGWKKRKRKDYPRYVAKL